MKISGRYLFHNEVHVMIACVITEQQPEADLLRRILPDTLCDRVWIGAGGGVSGISGVKSLASTMAVSRGTPVAIVVDAKSTDPEMIQYRRQDIEEVVLYVSTGVPIKVILAVPQLEIVFFQDPQLLRRLFDSRVTAEILCLARANPRCALNELLAGSDSIHQPEEILAALTPQDFETLRQADVIRELADFLRQVRELAPSTARAS
jgi:hypothetical protein